MADEHVHTWVYSIENAGVCQRDCVCGAHDQIDVPKLEQQLAQEKEAHQKALQWGQYNADLATQRFHELTEKEIALAQAREETERVRALAEKHMYAEAQAVAQHTYVRSLLERLTTLLDKPLLLEVKEGIATNTVPYSFDPNDLAALIYDASAFLAQHKEAPGDQA